ncbi:plasmid mobilization protein [Enterobacteriaceae bacterium A-F18]|nr:plasmid mobilization protein [Enterobacteriaceae bacterium A-F18]
MAYFSGGLLLFLPGMRQKRAQQILAVRVIQMLW